jgi:hypothetical protein
LWKIVKENSKALKKQWLRTFKVLGYLFKAKVGIKGWAVKEKN